MAIEHSVEEPWVNVVMAIEHSVEHIWINMYGYSYEAYYGTYLGQCCNGY